jgi:hypothetical protein
MALPAPFCGAITADPIPDRVTLAERRRMAQDAPRVIPPDSAIFQRFHIVEAPKGRGAYARTARALGVSDEHVRQVVKRHHWEPPKPTLLCRVETPLPFAQVQRGALDNVWPLVMQRNITAINAMPILTVVMFVYLLPLVLLLPWEWKPLLVLPVWGAWWVAGPR